VSGLKRVKFVYPTRDVMMSYHNVLQPIISKLKMNFSENKSLAKTRDTLLPKLISGEIRVPEVLTNA